MKLHSPRFERRLRRAVKRAVRRSSELRRAARRATAARRISAGPLLRLVASGGLAALVWRAHEVTQRPDAALAVISLWLGLLAIFRAEHLLNCLFAPDDGSALACLPISNDDVFRWQMQKFLRGCGFTVVDVLVAFAVLGFLGNLSWVQWALLLPVAFAAVWGTIATAAFLATRAVRVIVIGRWALIPVGLAVLFTARWIPWEALVRFLDAQSFWITLLLPTGWALGLLHPVLDPSDWLVPAHLALFALLLWQWRGALARLRDGYGFGEVELPEAPDDLSSLPEEDQPAPATAHGPVRAGPTAIEDGIRSRRFLAPVPWCRNGWMERLLWRWLTPRERALADFTFPGGLSLTAAWKVLFRNLLGIAAISVALGFVSPVLGVWASGLGLFVVLIHGFMLSQTSGAAFEKVPCSGVFIQQYAAYGIGYRELSRVLIKTTLVQAPMIALAALLGAILCAQVTLGGSLPLREALRMALVLAVFFLVLRLPLLVLQFSSGTNDSSRFTLVMTVTIPGIVLGSLAFIGFAASAVLVTDVVVSCFLLGGAVLSAGWMFRLYGWAYNANRFDLMNLRKETL